MKYDIIGYANSVGVEPAPLITIIRDINKDLVAIFPDCSLSKLNCSGGEDAYLKGIIQQDGKKIIENGQYSYVDYDGNIHTRTHENMIQIMKKDMIHALDLGDSDIHQALKKMIDG